MRHLLVLGVILLLTACGGSGSKGTGPNLGPVITSLAERFGGGCVLNGFRGTVIVGSVSYTDSDGDLAGGIAQITGTFLPSGPSIDRNLGIPSESVRLTGTTSGTVTVFLCLRFGLASGVRFSAAVIDNSGHSSNILTATVTRPEGAPLKRAD